MVSLNEREQHELNHGKYLIESGNPELLWNWDSPAGRWRANRRGRLLRETAKLQAGQRVMEVGCGTGLFTEMIAASQASILTVDVSLSSVTCHLNRLNSASCALKTALLMDPLMRLSAHQSCIISIW
jgi:2-polyprenyl-3-methyl-5-hydroxy-6-metoxy-1,4-benzoquinol methylase